MNAKHIQNLRTVILNNKLTGTEVRILFYLIGLSRTATMIAREVGAPQPTVARAVGKLQKLGLIQTDRIEGRNRFFVCNLDALPTNKGEG